MAKPARKMNGVRGPTVAAASVLVLGLLSQADPSWGVVVHQTTGTVTIKIEAALAALAGVFGGAGLGIYGRLTASETWNGSVLR